MAVPKRPSLAIISPTERARFNNRKSVANSQLRGEQQERNLNKIEKDYTSRIHDYGMTRTHHLTGTQTMEDHSVNCSCGWKYKINKTTSRKVALKNIAIHLMAVVDYRNQLEKAIRGEMDVVVMVHLFTIHKQHVIDYINENMDSIKEIINSKRI